MKGVCVFPKIEFSIHGVEFKRYFIKFIILYVPTVYKFEQQWNNRKLFYPLQRREHAVELSMFPKNEGAAACWKLYFYFGVHAMCVCVFTNLPLKLFLQVVELRSREKNKKILVKLFFFLFCVVAVFLPHFYLSLCISLSLFLCVRVFQIIPFYTVDWISLFSFSLYPTYV